MTVELSTEEIEIIAGWYYAASSESKTDQDAAMFALLDKLGIEASDMDLHYPDPEDVRPQYRAEVEAVAAAIKAYRLRHPELKAVREAEARQPTT